ncbi:MAG: EthD family reductase [Dehalococcoidales bacterium]|nr:EthD family reductase [Dehalococcoidales bacterium]
MIKTIALAYRRPGLTREEYNRYWLEKHGPLAAKLIPGIRRYVQNHFIEVPGMEFEGDGIVEMWYDDVQSWQKSLAAIRTNKELMEDGAKFAQMKPGGFWVVEEHVILDTITKK